MIDTFFFSVRSIDEMGWDGWSFSLPGVLSSSAGGAGCGYGVYGAMSVLCSVWGGCGLGKAGISLHACMDGWMDCLSLGRKIESCLVDKMNQARGYNIYEMFNRPIP